MYFWPELNSPEIVGICAEAKHCWINGQHTRTRQKKWVLSPTYCSGDHPVHLGGGKPTLAAKVLSMSFRFYCKKETHSFSFQVFNITSASPSPLSFSYTHTHTSLFLLFIYSLTSRLYILWLMHSQLQSSAQTPSFPPNLQLLLFAASFRALPFQPHEQVLVSEEFYQNFPLGVPLSHRVLSSHPDGWCAGRTQVKFMSLRVWKSPAPPGGL